MCQCHKGWGGVWWSEWVFDTEGEAIFPNMQICRVIRNHGWNTGEAAFVETRPEEGI